MPTNTELRVLYFGTLRAYDEAGGECDAPIDRLRLLDQHGASIELIAAPEPGGNSQSWRVASPFESLAARTTYSLQVPFSAGGDCNCSWEAVWTTLSEFVTGDGPDDSAPELAGLEKLSVGPLRYEENDCGIFHGQIAGLDVVGARDDSPDLRYDFYVDGELKNRYASLANTLFIDCGTSALVNMTIVDPGARIELRAVDLAGHTSSLSTAVHAAPACNTDAGDGCSLTSLGSRHGHATAVVFFAMVLLLSGRALRAIRPHRR